MVFPHLLALFELSSLQGEVASLRLILNRPFAGDEIFRDEDRDIAESKGQTKIEEVVEFGAVQWKEDQKEGHHTESLRQAKQKLC